MRKKIIGILLLFIIFSLVNKQEVLAYDENLVYGDYIYSYDDQGRVWIDKYTGKGKEIVVPASIDGSPVIGAEICENNKRITKVTFSEGIEYVGGLGGCSNLKEVYLPKSTRWITMDAFRECKKLKKITLPNGLEKIEYMAFYKCTALKEISIPDSVTTMDLDAFWGCKNLEKVKLSKNLEYIEMNTFRGCKKLKSITIPNKVISISDDAFSGCTSLKSVKLPASLKEICDRAFWGCTSLREVTIPKKVTYIGNGAFVDCKKLKKVTIKSKKVKRMGNWPFGGIHPKAVVDVPDSCIDKYSQMMTGASNFPYQLPKVK
ncbi:MAG: leucine-rich repeat domain-containing protein [Lachnospiraceae bacterium]|nr:leucine-rich repeat domain-containing protein [Lachnospiraceae bacterium]